MVNIFIIYFLLTHEIRLNLYYYQGNFSITKFSYFPQFSIFVLVAITDQFLLFFYFWIYEARLTRTSLTLNSPVSASKQQWFG